MIKEKRLAKGNYHRVLDLPGDWLTAASQAGIKC
jgi:hypothetical protein